MPAGHPHEVLARGKAPHDDLFTPGKGLMPHKLEGSDPRRFFAKENGEPLGSAFEGKIAVHPGMGGIPVSDKDREPLLNKAAATPCPGRKLAYVHVPFCETHCLYCSFFQNPYRDEAGAAYVDTLIRDLALWCGEPAQAGDPIHAVYLGGGTPTALAPRDLDRLLRAVRTYLPLANDCELTVEGRTANITPALIEAALENGVNRFSLGVQSFDTDIRRAMGRTLRRDELVQSIRLLQSYGQASVVIDLIYGLPGQTMSVWQKDLDTARSLDLDGMDCYQLGVHKGSPLAKAIANGKVAPAADAPQMGAMFAASVRELESAFYRRLSVNHWSRTPRERNIYNLYTRGSASCLGFGPGAGGNLQGTMTYNFRDIERWRETVNSGHKPVGMLLKPVPLAGLNKALTEGMELGRLEMPALETKCAEYGYAGLSCKDGLRKLAAPLLDQWHRAGLLEPHGQSYVLTVAGQFWYVNLTQLLIEYISENSVASHEMI